MTQHKAISTLKDLLPEINDTRDPEGVLIKYAHAQNLAPAQLEKLAHVFNTLKTINVMDKSAAGRGASFDILDPEAMLDKFQAEKPTKKKAGATQDGIYLEKVASGGVQRAVHAEPSWGTSETDDIPELNRQNRVPWALDKRASGDEEVIELYQASEIARQERNEALQDFVKQASTRGGTETSEKYLHESIQDIRALAPVDFSITEPHLKRAAAHLLANPIPDARVVFWDRGNVLPLFEKYANAVTLCGILTDEIAEFEKRAAFPQVNSIEDLNNLQERAQYTKNPDDLFDAKLLELAQGPALRGKDWDQRKAKEQTDERIRRESGIDEVGFVGRRPGEKGFAEAAQNMQNYKDRRTLEADQKARGQDAGPGKLDSLDMLGSLSDGISGAIGGLTDAARSSMSLDTAKSVATNYIDMVNPAIRDRDKKVQRAQNSARSVANLQRLMLNDPVISQADPDQVVNAYNSLRRANPELVDDINVARSLLRESLQYPHLPLNTLQSLISMRETAVKTKSHDKPTSSPANAR